MIKNLLQEGFALKNRGHYKHAIEVFYKAMEADNTSSELMLEIADLYYLMNNEEKSLNYIEQILDKDPAHIEALKLLKKIFIDKNALQEAEQTAKNIYCISHSSNDLAEIFRLLNKQQKYNEIFEYNIEHTTSAVALELARAMYYKNDYCTAEAAIKSALQQDINNQDLLLLLGKIYQAQNKKTECIELAQKLDKDSNNPEVLNFIGLSESYSGNYYSASAYLLAAIKAEPKNSEYYYNLANIYFKQAETSSAKKYYNLAISLNPGNPNYHFALANLYYSGKHYKKALEELTADFFEAKLLKAIILYDTGYLALAKKELAALAQERPENQIVQEYKSKINTELGLS